MKTAMQELRNKVVSWVDHGGSDDLLIVIIAIDKWGMEKEKEQIIDAFEVGYKSCDLDEAFEIDRKLASGELHYNKNYNQNK